jgi:hypothetical protein
LRYEAFYLNTGGPQIPVASFLEEKGLLRVTGFPVGTLSAANIDIFKSQHGSPENGLITFLMWMASLIPTRIMDFFLRMGVVNLIRLARRFSRNKPYFDAILESLEVDLNRKPEGPEEEYPYFPINLAETTNSFDRRETAFQNVSVGPAAVARVPLRPSSAWQDVPRRLV